LYTISLSPVWLMMTGMWTDSCLVPGLMRMSMPDLPGSVLVVISMLAVLFREASAPVRRGVVGPLGGLLQLRDLFQQFPLSLIHAYLAPSDI